jgi:hypothetical protein
MAALRESVAKAYVEISVSIAVRIQKRDQEAACRRRIISVIAAAPGIHIDDPIRSNHEMPGVADVVGKYGCAESRGQGNSAVVPIAGLGRRGGQI